MPDRHHPLRAYLLAGGDAAAMYLALWLTLRLRYGDNLDASLWWQHVAVFSAVFALWLLTLYASGLYDLSASDGRTQFGIRLAGALLVGATAASTFFYLGSGRLFSLRPQKVLLINLAITYGLMLGWRALLVSVFRSPRLSRRVLLIGSHAQIPKTIAELLAKPHLGFIPVVWLKPGQGPDAPTFAAELTMSSHLDELWDLCQRHRVDLIISGIDPRNHDGLLRELLRCRQLKIDFVDLSTFTERITGKVPVEAIGQVWFLENFTEGTKRPYELAKRIFDVTAAATGLILSLPLLPFLYLLVKFSSDGPFLFRQIRLGLAGRPFTAVKIRTMRTDAERAGPQWARDADPRVTGVGRWLRQLRLDEIPQLYNVLRGEMSFIGPRPERPEFIAELRERIPFYEERLLVKPGLTGWAQVNFPYGASVQDALEKLQYDLFYIKHRSLGLDLSIALRTIGTILSRSGR